MQDETKAVGAREGEKTERLVQAEQDLAALQNNTESAGTIFPLDRDMYKHGDTMTLLTIFI